MVNYMVKFQRSGDWENYFAKTEQEAEFVARTQVNKKLYDKARIYKLVDNSYVLIEVIGV